MKKFLVLKLLLVLIIISSLHSAYGSRRSYRRRGSRPYKNTDFNDDTDDDSYEFNRINEDLNKDEIDDVSLKLGANLWDPQSVVPEPPFMNSGGLPTGTNMYAIAFSKRGLIGSLIVMGTSRNINQKYKYYGIYPSPYKMLKEEGFSKYSRKSVAMYTIFPITSNRRSKNITRPSFAFMPMYLPSVFQQRNQRGVYRFNQYSIFSKNYVGKCHRPILPKNTFMACKTNQNEIICEFWCERSNGAVDITTLRENKCWHSVGVWNPTKNMLRCRRNRKRNCNIRRLAGDERIRWVCTRTKNETKCRIKCQEPKVFLAAPAEEYYCWPNGTWTPTHIPKCVDPGPILRTVLWS